MVAVLAIARWTRIGRRSRVQRLKPTRLSRLPGLVAMVEEKLERKWSPQQISGWLRRRFPTSTVMRVSHETIYWSLFVQARGDLRRELTRHLRTRRAMRRPAGTRLPDGRGARPNTVNISQRPAEAPTGRCLATGRAIWSSDAACHPSRRW